MKTRSEARHYSRVRPFRATTGMSRQELAARSSVSFYRLGLIERGFAAASEKEQALIAKALGAKTVEDVFPPEAKPAATTAVDLSQRYLAIDLVFAGEYAAAIVGPRELADGTIQPSRTIELDDEARTSLQTREGKRALRKRLERIFDALSAPPGAASEPAEWSAA